MKVIFHHIIIIIIWFDRDHNSLHSWPAELCPGTFCLSHYTWIYNIRKGGVLHPTECILRLLYKKRREDIISFSASLELKKILGLFHNLSTKVEWLFQDGFFTLIITYRIFRRYSVAYQVSEMWTHQLHWCS